jgi:hypothetical protein
LKKFCFVCLFFFSINAKGQKDSIVKSLVKDSLSKTNLSINSGVNLPLPYYPLEKIKPGPEFDLNLKTTLISPYFDFIFKAFYLSNQFTYMSMFSGQNNTMNESQSGELAGFTFTLPVKNFSIGISLLAGLYQYAEYTGRSNIYYDFSYYDNIFNIGLNLNYSISRKWFINFNTDFISTISTVDYPNQDISLTAGVGYKF